MVRVFPDVPVLGWKLDDEARATRLGAVDPRPAAVPRRQIADDGETDPRSRRCVMLAR